MSTSIADSTDWLSTSLPQFGPLEAALRCQVCKDFLHTPMITSCSHTFCSLCIRRCLAVDGRCPACRAREQESRLRNNGALDEVVEAFQLAREKALELAQELTRLDGLRREGTPKRKRSGQDGEGMEGIEHQRSSKIRKTRSQTARQDARTSQPLEETFDRSVQVIDDSGDEDHVPIEAPKPPSPPPIPPGSAPCPICNSLMKLDHMFDHVGRCNGTPIDGAGSGVPSKPVAFASQPRQSLSKPQAIPPSMKRLPNLSYGLLSEPALRKKLNELGIPAHGSKGLMIKRHTEWVNLWNANCDSRRPRMKGAVLGDLEMWDKAQGIRAGDGQVSVNGWANRNGADGANNVMRKDFDGRAWTEQHRTEFDDLIAKAKAGRKKGTTAKAGQDRASSVTEVGSADVSENAAPLENQPPESSHYFKPPEAGTGSDQKLLGGKEPSREFLVPTIRGDS